MRHDRWWWIPARVLAGVAVSGMLASCVSPGQAPPILIDVPFLEQPPDRCGAASVTMVARRWGFDLDMDALDRDVYIPALAGTVPELMAEGARRQGLAARIEKGADAELQRLMQAGIPPIVMLGPEGGDPRGHFVVATGLNPRTGALRVHSGREQNRWMARNAWYPRWLQAGCCVVVITRP